MVSIPFYHSLLSLFRVVLVWSEILSEVWLVKRVSSSAASDVYKRQNQLQRELRLTVRLIKGHYARRIRIDTSLNTELSKPAARLHYDWQGFLWLSTNMRNEIAALVILLQRSRNKWLDKKELQRLKEYLRNDTDPKQQ